MSNDDAGQVPSPPPPPPPHLPPHPTPAPTSRAPPPPGYSGAPSAPPPPPPPFSPSSATTPSFPGAPVEAPTPSRPGLAVAALVLGIIGVVLCFVFIPSLLALIFGLVAAKRIKQSGGSLTGRGMARAGWILGAVGLAVGAVFWALAAAGVLEEDDPDPYDIEVGDCANVGELADRRIAAIPDIDCSEPHDSETFLLGNLNPDDTEEFPGDDAARQAVADVCSGQAFTDYVGTSYEASEFDVFYIYPERRAWGSTDGAYVCLVYSIDGRTLTESVRGSGR